MCNFVGVKVFLILIIGAMFLSEDCVGQVVFDKVENSEGHPPTPYQYQGSSREVTSKPSSGLRSSRRRLSAVSTHSENLIKDDKSIGLSAEDGDGSVREKRQHEQRDHPPGSNSASARSFLVNSQFKKICKFFKTKKNLWTQCFFANTKEL